MIVIVADKDNDGMMGAAVIAHAEWANDKKVIFTRSGQTIDHPGIVSEIIKLRPEKVYLIDLMLKMECMVFLQDKFGVNLIWFDHHESNIEEAEDWTEVPFNGIQQSVPGVSACLLAWQWFQTDEKLGDSPRSVNLLSAYDTFYESHTVQFNQKVIPFQIAMERMRNLLVYQTVLNRSSEDIDEIIAVGELMWLGEIDEYDQIKKDPFMTSSGKRPYNVMVFEDVRNIGRIAHLVRTDSDLTDVDFVISCRKLNDGSCTHGIRSINGTSCLDYIHELKTYRGLESGGGHKLAAGMRTYKNLFEL